MGKCRDEEKTMKIWMSQKEIETIEKYLTPETTMLEYGCGGSTLHFPKFVKQYYSIEHQREWYNKIKNQISEVGKTKIFLVENKEVVDLNVPLRERIHAQNWGELERTTRYDSFEQYIKSPSLIGKKFDAVLIDGRARPECAKFIYEFLEDNAYVFIHDYWPRKHYHVVEEKYEVVDHVKWGQSLAVFQKK